MCQLELMIATTAGGVVIVFNILGLGPVDSMWYVVVVLLRFGPTRTGILASPVGDGFTIESSFRLPRGDLRC